MTEQIKVIATTNVQIEEVVFEPLEGCNEMFKEMTAMVCCGTQGGHMCRCGPMM